MAAVLALAALLLAVSGVALLAKRRWGWFLLGGLCLAVGLVLLCAREYLGAVCLLVWAWSCRDHYADDPL